MEQQWEYYRFARGLGNLYLEVVVYAYTRDDALAQANDLSVLLKGDIGFVQTYPGFFALSNLEEEG